MFQALLLSYARDIGPSSGWSRAASFLVRSLVHRRLAHHWLDVLEGAFADAAPRDLRVHLAQKFARPYVRPWFSTSERIAVLTDHYDHLVTTFSRAALDRFLRHPGMPIATLTGKSGQRYTLILGLARSKEGEVSLTFNDADTGTTFATLIGVLGPRDGRLVFWIGGLQGPKPPLGRDDIVRVTRDLHGLRPKHAVLHAAMLVAKAFGATEIVAPARANHISRRRWTLWRHRRDIKSDYDSFWSEFATGSYPDGDYRLPVTPAVRALEDVKSKKRKEWTSRQGHLGALSASVVASLDAGRQELAPEEPPSHPQARAAM